MHHRLRLHHDLAVAPECRTLAKMCTSSACAKMTTALVALDLGDCTVGTLNIQDLIDTDESTCDSSNFKSGSSVAVSTVISSNSSSASFYATKSVKQTTTALSTNTSMQHQQQRHGKQWRHWNWYVNLTLIAVVVNRASTQSSWRVCTDCRVLIKDRAHCRHCRGCRLCYWGCPLV